MPQSLFLDVPNNNLCLPGWHLGSNHRPIFYIMPRFIVSYLIKHPLYLHRMPTEVHTYSINIEMKFLIEI